MMLRNKTGGSRFVPVKNPAFMLVIALVICLVSACGSSLVKSGGGSITVKQLHWETPSGHMQSAQLLIPETATAKTPAPAVVVAHGWGDTREVQEPNYVELSRRGYIVLDIDMYGHGDSEDLPINTWWDEGNAANGVYDGVQLLATLPYVDVSQIGIEGHSNGAYSCNMAILLDNEAETPLISSVLFECNDAFYTEASTSSYGSFIDGADTDFANVYGNRNVGIIAAKYDEAFHRIQYPDGTITAPRDFIDQPQAQSFLYFGKDPTGIEARDSSTVYTETIDGKEAIRVLYNPDITHCRGYLSIEATRDFIDFFQNAMPAPDPLPAGDQVWPWKVFFEALGLVGFFIFLVSFILALLETKFFGVLKAREPVEAAEVDRKGKKWLWWGLALCALFSAISYPIIWAVGQLAQPAFFNQWEPWAIGLWSVCMGLFTLLFLVLNYRKYFRAKGLSLREKGVFMSKDKLLKSILLGVLAAVCTYFLVFLSTYFFTTDFRFWFILAFRAFDAVKLSAILKFALFFVFFYVINSIAMNVFNYVKIGKKEWVNTVVMSVFNTLGPVLLLIGFYSYFFTTGLLPVDHVAWGLGTMILWIYPMVAILPIATVINRIIYKKTRNPYISSIAFALIVTGMICTSTLTYLI
jgi:hypothetical protein